MISGVSQLVLTLRLVLEWASAIHPRAIAMRLAPTGMSFDFETKAGMIAILVAGLVLAVLIWLTRNRNR